MTQQQQAQLQAELDGLRGRIAQLEKTKRDLERRLSQTSEAAEPAPLITTQSELESTLGAFVKRVGVIIQAEKCVILLYDRETGELVAQWPALGLNQEQVRTFRLRATQGISGEIFRDGKPMVSHDAVADPRTSKEFVALLNVRNLLGVPLVVERRDAQQQVLERNIIGVLSVFNKRGGGSFNDEDVRLMTVLARSAAALISNAQFMIQIAAEKHQLESTLQSMLAGVVVISRNGRVLLINSAARRILGLPVDDGVGKTASDVLTDEDVRRILTDSLSRQEEITEELTLQATGERIYQIQTALLREEEEAEPSGIVATFNDITEIRKVERMKTEFVSSVSHELRTPLTSIKGFVRTLLDDTDGYYDRETQREFYQIIDAECDRLTRLIEDLLNVSRIESGQALQIDLRTVDLAALINKVVTSQKSYTTKHRFYTDVPEAARYIVADEDKVDQLLTNLISNAIKYSPNGGRVAVMAKDSGPSVAIAVEDEGVGIPADHLDKIFARFHRVEGNDASPATGTGIGLYLVKHLVDAHGGKITVKSKVGKGSTFTVMLPKSPPEPTPAS